MGYFENAARVLTKVFQASRLHEVVTPEMVELIMEERDREIKRGSQIIEKIKEFLIEANYECDRKKILDDSDKKEVIISGRVKTVDSAIYNLLAPKNGKPQNLNDMLGLMIICEDKMTCYDIRNLLIEKLTEINDVIISEKDMIKNPKPNGYQSLHMHVSTTDGIVFEIQIKSNKMFAFSQTGDCKHALYKKHLDASCLDRYESMLFNALREEHWF